MSHKVSDERLDVIHLQISDAIRRRRFKKATAKTNVWLEIEGTPVCEANDLSCLLDELRLRRQTASRTNSQVFTALGEATRLFMSLKPGEFKTVKPIPRTKRARAAITARAQLGIPGASWRSTVLANGDMMITRMQDGVSGREQPENPAIDQLASMKVGDVVKILTCRGSMTKPIREKARLKMCKPNAKWRCEKLTTGNLRCERVA